MDNAAIFRYLRSLRTRLFPVGLTHRRAFDEPPLRSELFSADQMEHHGRRLAAVHKLMEERPQDQLLARLAANEAVLINVCGRLAETVKSDRQVSPASEWLLDNYYLIEE